jgi:hypothetical protein
LASPFCSINRLGPSSGPQTFQFYCPVGEKLLGYSVSAVQQLAGSLLGASLV